MKQVLAFALLVTIGMFIIGCSGSDNSPKAKPDAAQQGSGFSSTGQKAPTPNKKP
jgi:hypothetical protein